MPAVASAAAPASQGPSAAPRSPHTASSRTSPYRLWEGRGTQAEGPGHMRLTETAEGAAQQGEDRKRDSTVTA
jgi:hypothetical protein